MEVGDFNDDDYCVLDGNHRLTVWRAMYGFFIFKNYTLSRKKIRIAPAFHVERCARHSIYNRLSLAFTYCLVGCLHAQSSLYLTQAKMGLI